MFVRLLWSESFLCRGFNWPEAHCPSFVHTVACTRGYCCWHLSSAPIISPKKGKAQKVTASWQSHITADMWIFPPRKGLKLTGPLRTTPSFFFFGGGGWSRLRTRINFQLEHLDLPTWDSFTHHHINWGPVFSVFTLNSNGWRSVGLVGRKKKMYFSFFLTTQNKMLGLLVP